MAKVLTILPGCTRLLSLVITPFSTQVDRPVGEHFGVHAQIAVMASAAQTALGMAPMPICSVAPSSISSAQ